MTEDTQNWSMKPDRAEVMLELENFCAWRRTRKAKKLNRFVGYVVERSLAGDFDSLRGKEIAAVLWGDPLKVGSVKAAARKAKDRLTQYYQTEGEVSRVRIIFKDRDYVADFFKRPPNPEVVPARVTAERRLIQAQKLQVLVADRNEVLFGWRRVPASGAGGMSTVEVEVREYEKQAGPPPLTEEELEESVVMLIEGENLDGEQIHVVIELTLRELREMSRNRALGCHIRAFQYGKRITEGLGNLPAEEHAQLGFTHQLQNVPVVKPFDEDSDVFHGHVSITQVTRSAKKALTAWDQDMVDKDAFPELNPEPMVVLVEGQNVAGFSYYTYLHVSPERLIDLARKLESAPSLSRLVWGDSSCGVSGLSSIRFGTV